MQLVEGFTFVDHFRRTYPSILVHKCQVRTQAAGSRGQQPLGAKASAAQCYLCAAAAHNTTLGLGSSTGSVISGVVSYPAAARDWFLRNPTTPPRTVHPWKWLILCWVFSLLLPAVLQRCWHSHVSALWGLQTQAGAHSSRAAQTHRCAAVCVLARFPCYSTYFGTHWHCNRQVLLTSGQPAFCSCHQRAVGLWCKSYLFLRN
jgi:hypothetical protein